MLRPSGDEKCGLAACPAGGGRHPDHVVKLLIKLGGALLESEERRRAIAAQIAAQASAGHQTVVVHGGGKRLSRYLERGGYQSEFRRGFRVTPPEIMDAVLRIFAGEVNHHLVAELQREGARAVGLSGIDGGLVQAVELDPDLGAVGRVEHVEPALLDLLTESGFLPTVACVAGGENGAIFNVNADQMAVACAAGFAADQLIFLTDVDGVHDENKKLLPHLTPASAEHLIAGGVAEGGMEAKLRAAMAGLAQGVGRVRIAAGKEPGILARLLGGETLGTTLQPD